MPSRLSQHELVVDHLTLTAVVFVDETPNSLKEAKTWSDYKKWKKAVNEEIISLQKKQYLHFVQETVKKWVFRSKKVKTDK